MCTILVIDDEKGILRVIEEALTRFGHDVEIAADGYEGIQKFDDGSYDMVITDLRMPGIDGKGVVRHIRNSRKNCVPVIGISGTPWLIQDLGFDAVLPKPFPLQDLVESVKKLSTIATGLNKNRPVLFFKPE
jgi:DNA-binding response OmpR family regulator